MNLDDQYNPAHRQAVALQGQFHDYVSRGPNPYNPQANILQHEIHNLVGELERHDHPQNIENRIKIIQRQIRNEQIRQHPIMHYDHLNDLQTHYERLRQQMRTFDHY